MMELALINCRQLQTICGVGNTVELADKNAAAVIKTISGLTNSEKCSWNIKATTDAPSFKITTAVSDLIRNDDTGYDIHYIEYDDTADKEVENASVTSDWMSYINNKEHIISTKYERDKWYGIEYPYMYVKLDPAESAPIKRYFPGKIMEVQIKEYETRKQGYSSLLSAYEVLRATYDDLVDKTKANTETG